MNNFSTCSYSIAGNFQGVKYFRGFCRSLLHYPQKIWCSHILRSLVCQSSKILSAKIFTIVHPLSFYSSKISSYAVVLSHQNASSYHTMHVPSVVIAAMWYHKSSILFLVSFLSATLVLSTVSEIHTTSHQSRMCSEPE